MIVTPAQVLALPTDSLGRNVPWFVSWRPGNVIDWVNVDPYKQRTAIRFKVCWICGSELPEQVTFVLGPMCGINRISAEPPCCPECAEFAVVVCPFMLKPTKGRSRHGSGHSYGVAIVRNPGVTLLWTVGREDYAPEKVGEGILLHFDEPIAVKWFREGREATRGECDKSVREGLPLLRRAAENDIESLAIIERRYQALKAFYPVRGVH